MLHNVRRLALVWGIILLGASSFAAEKEPVADNEGDPFLRLHRNAAEEPIALETAIVSYSPKDGSRSLTVDLVGAIHIGDKAYYEELNKAFQAYDAVLYELVAPPDAAPKPGERALNSVSFLQLSMKRLLGLEFQLDCIEYDKPNFVHADMTPEEFSRSMAERGESFTQMFLRMLGQSIAMQSRDPARSGDAQLFAALFTNRRERAARLKRVMAEQFQDMKAATSILDGPDGSTILTERNKAALRVLTRQIAAGNARIAIFYGAAHLPDMSERLEKDFQLAKTGTRWVVAWDLNGEKEAGE